MKKHLVLVAVATALCILARADDKKTWDGSYKPFQGQYLVYSGELGEQAVPTRTERKAAIMIEGLVAKELFDAIGPDLKDACGTLSGLRVRQKGDVDCTYDKDTPSAPYTCHFGFNLRTGKSIGGSIC
jgi:hypothetical protein